MATEVIDELIALLGFEFDDSSKEAIKSFQEEIADATEDLVNLTKIAVAAAGAVGVFVVATAESLTEQVQFSDRIKESSRALQEWDFIVQDAGGSADGLRSSLTNLNQIISEASRGQGAGVEVFGLLGIQIRDSEGQLKKGSQILTELSQKFEGLSGQEQVEFARKLGIDDGLILTLQRGSGEIERLRQRANDLGAVISDKGLRAAEAFQTTWLEIQTVFKGIANETAVELLPLFQELADELVRWFLINREIISQNLAGFIEVTTEAVKFFISTVRSFITTIRSLVENTIGWERAFKLLNAAIAIYVSFRLGRLIIATAAAFKALAVSMTLANAAALLIPTLIGALLIGLALLAEDAMVAIQGGDSVIRDFLDFLATASPTALRAFEILGAGITKVIEGWKLIMEEFVNLFSGEGFFADAIRLAVKFSPAGLLFNGSDTIRETVKSSSSVLNDNRSVKVDANVQVTSAGDARKAGQEFGRGLEDSINQGRLNSASSRSY